MFDKLLTTIKVSTDLYQIRPLQQYIGYMAKYCHVPHTKLLYLKILIEEVFSHIVIHAFNNRRDGEIEIQVSVTPADFVLRFHYLGIPFGYSLDKVYNDDDEISLRMIKNLSSNYSINQDGKKGQTVEVKLSIETKFYKNLKARLSPSTPKPDIALATDEVTLREIRDNEMEMLVQCLWQVFGYTYSADAVYYPEVLLQRKESGVYRGFVAVNTKQKVVAHAALLLNTPTDVIGECGQAFVSPAYGKRGLFNHLKKMLLDKADEIGLRGIFSSAVTGHPFTQKANIALGCIETGLELAYIPAQLMSMIERDGADERQSVMNYFYLTSHQEEITVYPPSQHRDIITSSYQHLGLKRRIAQPADELFIPDEESEIDMISKTEWNQVHIHIIKVGKDLGKRIDNIIRQSMVSGAEVFYIPLSLGDKNTAYVVNQLESLGFFYSGIMPYEMDGIDSIRMQYIPAGKITPDYIIAESDWGKELKNYIFEQKRKQEDVWK